MSAPLPRVYELGEGGKAVAVPPPPGTAGIIGGDFKGDDLTRSSKETVTSPFFVIRTDYEVQSCFDAGHDHLRIF
jgi:hypothetical protein